MNNIVPLHRNRAPTSANLDRVAAAIGRQVASANTIDAETIIYRLEEAGHTLLALPDTGYSTRMRTTQIDVVRDAVEAYGWNTGNGRLRPAMPDSARITRMDEALAWIPLIPRDRYVLRRIVGARCLVSPVTERHLFAWRRLATLLGADHKAIQRWHAQGIDLIVAILNAP
jgi:hypothetical protein